MSFAFASSKLKGKTIDIEFEEFQKSPIDLFMYYTPIEQNLVLTSNKQKLVKTYVSSIDINDEPAKTEMEIAMKMIKDGYELELYANHTRAFKNIWNYGRIEVDDVELQRRILGSYYYLLSSVPSIEHHGKLNQFYGLSPGSLSRGSRLIDYQGHSFWDTGNLIYLFFWLFFLLFNELLKLNSG